MANNIYLAEGTAKVIKSSGGDAVITYTSVANGAGRISAQLDLGAAPRPQLYRWVLSMKFQATPVVGNLVRPYLIEASSAATTYQDGQLGLSDAAISSETVSQYSGKLLGPCSIQLASTAVQVWSGKTPRIFSRYVSLMVWNASGATFSSTATDFEFRLEPVFNQVQ